MSASDIAVSVRGLSKSYTIAHNDGERHVTLAEQMLHRLRNPFKRPRTETFHALKDVEFDIKKGDVVGIIGRNGAGKSTLLKILSRITEPTAGEIRLYGRVGSLLEVGTGFHPELTGRENIYLNGQILGMRRKEIDKQFDAIVDFAGVEKFLDTPVKRYSSGMYVRLAFAVAAHLESEILIIDEVLAVGDAEFQRKCLGKMKDVATGGRTVLFVSHQMQAVSALCNVGIHMRSGRLDFAGSVGEAIDRYMSHRGTAEPSSAEWTRRPGSGELRIQSLVTDRSSYLSTDDVHIDISVSKVRPNQQRYFISLEVVNSLGLPILHLDSRLQRAEFSASDHESVRYTIRSSRLAQGEYRIHAFLCSNGGIIDRFENATSVTISPILPYPASRNDCVGNALIYPDFSISSTTDTSPASAWSGR